MAEQQELAQQAPDKDARTWGMICHLAAFGGFVVPFGNVLGPLIVWAVKRDQSPFIDDQGKEALNFQLTMTIAFIVSFLLIFVLIGLLFIGVLCIYELIMVIVAAIKANDGETYRYPMTLRFFS